MQEADVPPAKANFFDVGSPFLTHPLLTEERTARELDAIEALLGPLTGSVLDVGCGFGRHSTALAQRGLSVVAIDPAPTMVAAAKERARAAGVSIDSRCISVADLDSDSEFDLVLCLFTSFGQLEQATGSDAPHVAGIDAMSKSLRPGGHMVLEVPDKSQLSSQLVEEEQLGPTHVTRSLDADTSVVTEVFAVNDGPTFDLVYRIFNSDELVPLMEQRGLIIDAVVGHGLVEPPTTMMTLVAHRPH